MAVSLGIKNSNTSQISFQHQAEVSQMYSSYLYELLTMGQASVLLGYEPNQENTNNSIVTTSCVAGGSATNGPEQYLSIIVEAIQNSDDILLSLRREQKRAKRRAPPLRRANKRFKRLIEHSESVVDIARAFLFLYPDDPEEATETISIPHNVGEEGFLDQKITIEKYLKRYTDAIERVNSTSHQTTFTASILALVLTLLAFVMLLATLLVLARAQYLASKLREEEFRQRFEREILDHRFGNRIRMARLFLDDRNFNQLSAILSTWELEVRVRQNKKNELPMNPISPAKLFAPAFNFPHTIECYADLMTPLVFFDRNGERVPFAIIQVVFLSDIASNICKHGGSKAWISIEPHAILITNKIIENPNLPPSNKVGLRALQELGEQYAMPTTFQKGKENFSVTIVVDSRVASEEEMMTSISDVSSPTPYPSLELGEKEEKNRADTEKCDDWKMSPDAPTTDVSLQYQMFLIEDSRAIAVLTARQFNHLGVQLHTIVSPSEVYNLAGTIAENYHRHRKPIVCIFDENLFSLNDNFDIITETGTRLRQRLLLHPMMQNLHDNGKLLFVSCSASTIEDDSTIICSLSKSVHPKKQVGILCEALDRRFPSGDDNSCHFHRDWLERQKERTSNSKYYRIERKESEDSVDDPPSTTRRNGKVHVSALSDIVEVTVQCS
eukprot:CAMPEP_0197286844 /NCGR_PEP_ID=MMETSP0890-20130614/2587_1 /TAXON_ID=44058 ORGANISM="Aureoumbra lagunensis, Strain CCMP1510" /NCGR_SAMPLE_ID=MMETSP0890 /ASSEMBLY_ACC=CAM_ASM_000533 /LENGTH=669 /DNA_ID=CAMNT_0042755695 /DNA_START=181 /DNA_END=2190 /DNA_ORIENTATION=+